MSQHYLLVFFLNRSRSTAVDNQYQSVSDFYAGKSVFLTGGTGFLGKAYIEKLLRGCEDIDKVFILIRQKKGEPIEARVSQMIKNPIFDRLRKTRPQVFNKIVPIIGDISEPKLGIKPKDEQTLKDEVSVVIHSAATVKYREPMQVAMNINFEGTRRIMDLCKGMRNLESFVYISTAFCHLTKKVLYEKIYPAPATVDEIYDFIKKYNNDPVETTKFLGPQPTTYTYTKCLTENYIGEHPEIPTTIVRPPAVQATYKEPVGGWLDNWYSSAGVCFDTARGLNHIMCGKTSNVVDCMPVDYVVNLTLVAGARQNSKDICAVYNSTSSHCNPVTWYEIHQAFIKENLKFGFYEGKPYVVFVNSQLVMDLVTFLQMKVPAHTADLFLRLVGKEPRHVKQLTRILNTRWSMAYFHTYNCVFRNDKARALYGSLSEFDKEKFPCDPTDIDWDEYLKIYFKGITEYLVPALLKKEKSTFVPKPNWDK
ncbi:hypothetical protein ABMA27_002293 [Loxostege sticticalis]|uniref:Fatty acyl-CoA reductase n=1 Tax=Loxostege sticticalis TaxID=481309 RepID=A0ABR3HX99_LOXSC